MKVFFIMMTLILSSYAFSEELKCEYLNHDSTKGEVVIKIDNTKVVLEFKSLTVNAQNCKIKLTPAEITAECENEGNSVGILFELIDGKFEGILMSEKASVFGQAKC